MVTREQLKNTIDQLDEYYLDLVFNIICQFPQIPDSPPEPTIADLFQDLADSGGLGIPDPLAWQRDIRQDRTLPFRDY